MSTIFLFSARSVPAAVFRVAHLLATFDAATGLLVKMMASPLRTHDLAQVASFHLELCSGDVLVGDAAFVSYVHLTEEIRGKKGQAHTCSARRLCFPILTFADGFH